VNIDKTYLTMGGIGVACLAAGAAGGYFFAKSKHDKELPAIIKMETEEVRKLLSVQIEELKRKPASPADIPKQAPARTVEGGDGRIHTSMENQTLAGSTTANAYHSLAKTYQGSRPETPAARAGRLAQEAKVARGEDPGELNPVVTQSIWDENSHQYQEPAPEKVRAPNGRFVSKAEALKHTSIHPTPGPYPISAEDFLAGERNFETVNLVWYIENKMLVDRRDDESVDIEVVGGEGVLALLEDTAPDTEGDRLIFVRNEGEGTDYEIKLSFEDLADVMAESES
jgi:hypothetical protein